MIEYSAVRVAPDRARSPLVLSVDLGSSSARVLAFDAQGRAVDGMIEQIRYEMDTSPDGGVQIDPEACVRYVVMALDGCLRHLRGAGIDTSRIAAVGVTTFWHNLIGIDAQGQPVTPLYSWADTRPHAAIAELAGRLDGQTVHARTGCRLHPSYLPAKLTWLRTTHPGAFAKAEHWLSIAEYLYLRLFGERICSHSMASGSGLYDLAQCRWDPEILDAVEVGLDQLSPLADLDQPMRGLRADFASRWPELNDVPWLLAVGDGASSNIGCGAVDESNLTLMVGTSGAMRTVYRGDLRPVPQGLWCYRIDQNRLLMGGALSNGGEVYHWLRNTFALENMAEITEELKGRPADGHGLTVLPFWAGERSPGWHGDASAAIIGLRLASGPLDIVQASLEAVGYRFGLIYERLRPVLSRTPRIIGSGGGLERSAVWTQMIADILGQPIALSPVEEGSARGVAALVLEQIGAIGDITDLGVPEGRVHDVDPRKHDIYQAGLERHRQLYQMLYP